ncbi:MAG: DUF4252 domain-containing protein [Bacteroidota bacterium]
MRTIQKTIIALFFIAPSMLMAQSKTTKALHEKYSDAFNLFFYNNTLKMMNQTDSEEFDMIIRDIEKAKVLRLDKEKYSFGTAEYKQMVSDYQSDGFEEVVNMRQKEVKFNAFIKEKNGKTLGFVVLMEEETSVYIVDIVGSVPLNELIALSQKMKDFKF